MHAFAHLYAALDAGSSEQAQLSTLLRYLAQATSADAAWAVYLLAGGKPSQTVAPAVLKHAAMQAAGLDEWLFDTCHLAVGDLAETISLVLPPPPDRTTDDTSNEPAGLAEWLERRLSGLRDLPAPEQASRLQRWWTPLDPTERWVLSKLVSSGWRRSVSALLMQTALARHAGLETHQIAQRMQGYTQARRRPSAERFGALIAPATEPACDAGRPYPFGIAAPFETPEAALADTLGPVDAWQVEWQYGGLRVQIVKRAGKAWIWSGDGELLNERFPELIERALRLPDGSVLDGELLAWQGDAPAAQAGLQPRLHRKSVSRALLTQWPVGLVAGDLLECDGIDRRSEPRHRRRDRLETLMASTRADNWQVGALLDLTDWAALTTQRRQGRAQGARGLMLRHRDSLHGEQARCWLWRSEPWTLHAVLLYAQADQGRHGGAGSEFTLTLWNRKPRDADEAQAVVEAIARREAAPPEALQLVSVAKTAVGLSEAERKQVDQVIRATTIERFGPVRSLRPTLVIELAFDALTRSARHKSGLALRGARMVRLRDDKPLDEADDLGTLEALLPRTPA